MTAEQMNAHAPKGWHSRGYLPHFDLPERVQHVVFQTAGSLPIATLDVDAHRDLCEGERPLTDPIAAQIAEDAIGHFDGARFRLFAWMRQCRKQSPARRPRDRAARLAPVVGAIARRLIRPPVIAFNARPGPRAFRLAFGNLRKDRKEAA